MACRASEGALLAILCCWANGQPENNGFKLLLAAVEALYRHAVCHYFYDGSDQAAYKTSSEPEVHRQKPLFSILCGHGYLSLI